MKKLFPFLIALLLLSSCHELREFFGCNEETEFTTNCEESKSAFIHYIFSIDPGSTDISEIKDIELSYNFAYNGAVTPIEEIQFNPDYGVVTNITPIGGSSYSMDAVISPNAIAIQSGGSPLEVAEIMIDMPTDALKGLPCTMIVSEITNVVVTFNNPAKEPENLSGCFKELEVGDCDSEIES